MPDEARLVQKVADEHRARIGKTPFPERDLEVCRLFGMRIEADRYQDPLGAPRRMASVVEDVVVEGVIEGGVVVGLQARLGTSEPVELSDLANDVARRIPVPWLDLVFFRIPVLFPARQRFGLAKLESGVKAP